MLRKGFRKSQKKKSEISYAYPSTPLEPSVNSKGDMLNTLIIKGFSLDCHYQFVYNESMGAKRTVDYPPWVEEWRGPGRTIRKIGSGYALYHCTTVKMPDGHSKIKQTYLGRITKEEGFIPKSGTFDSEPYLEYGLSHLIWENLRTDILHHFPSGTNSQVLKLGIIQFIFGSVDDVFLRSSYLTYGQIDKLLPLAHKLSDTRLQRVAKATEQELRKRIPLEGEYNLVVKLLMLSVVRPGHEVREKPVLAENVKEILDRQGLRM